MSRAIPLLDLTRQHRTMRDALNRAVGRVMASGRFILGPEVERFEQEFALVCGARFGVGVASGTDALELALRAAGIGPKDLVATVSFTFLSTAEAILKVGAAPLFIDIDPTTYTLDPGHLEWTLKKLTPSMRRRIKAILPVHLYGHPCAMGSILRTARRNGWWVIEDCAQAHGAAWHSKPVGSLGDLGCFSFYPTKNLGAYGDGGMVVVSSPQLARRLRVLRSQGRIDRERQVLEGRNSRLDELQAAILRVKLTYLSGWIRNRRRLAALYSRRLAGVDSIQVPEELPGSRHVYHLYAVQVRRRANLQAQLRKAGISTEIHYRIPVHRQLLYRDSAVRFRLPLPVTDRVAGRILSLPLFPELTTEEVDRVCAALRRFYTLQGV